jgi:hypothetical protein
VAIILTRIHSHVKEDKRKNQPYMFSVVITSYGWMIAQKKGYWKLPYERKISTTLI